MLPPALLDSPAIDLLVQSGQASSAQKAAALFGSVFVLAIVVGFALTVHFFFCYCLKRICEKVGHEPGLLVWFPLLNLIPQMQAAKLPLWPLALFILIFPIPFILVWNWMKLCEARGKPAPLGLIIIVPFGLPVLAIWLAFGD